jgi:hypothetical protein
MAMYSFFVARVFSVRGAQEEEKIERERERENASKARRIREYLQHQTGSN